ncbi:MAG: chemotaxis protein CheA [bacterium]|nr:chemotaxis protein CheA [bacterium]
MTGDNNIPDLSELYGEFVSENKEILERLARELVTFESSPEDPDIINSLFRSAHTLKGNAGFLGLNALGRIAHKIENILDSLRDGTLAFFPEINDVFFSALDVSNLLLEDFIGGKAEERDISSIISDIEALQDGGKKEVLTPLKEKMESTVVDEGRNKGSQEERDGSSMRVSTTRLDRMVNLVGELATGRSRLIQISNELKNEGLIEIAAQIETISTQLQDEVLGVRMVPVKDLFNRFYRLVRDTSRTLGKNIILTVEGEETELDKSVIEFLYDPLVHLVRNCIGHGIEGEEERLRLGKRGAGTIKLNAYHEHNSIFIEIKDDGRGLNIADIKRKALEKGLAGPEEIASISDADAARFIFSSGFSTAQEVDSVSGRGVGMDVVKSNIEKIGGDVRLDWEEGKGTTVMVRVPLTLAIVQLFLVREGSQVFGIPMSYVDETIMIKDGDFDYIKGQMVHMIRHRAVPVLKLSELFCLKEEAFGVFGPLAMNTVILNHMGMKAGIIIDEFMGKVETVIKPLGAFLESLSPPPEGISGASILGTGEIVLVLDVPTLWKGL